MSIVKLDDFLNPIKPKSESEVQDLISEYDNMLIHQLYNVFDADNEVDREEELFNVFDSAVNQIVAYCEVFGYNKKNFITALQWLPYCQISSLDVFLKDKETFDLTYWNTKD